MRCPKCDDAFGYSPKYRTCSACPPRPIRKHVTKELRAEIFERDGYACVFCLSEKDITIDHIWPKIDGGTSTYDNLQTLCRSCNALKGDRALVPWTSPLGVDGSDESLLRDPHRASRRARRKIFRPIELLLDDIFGVDGLFVGRWSPPR